MIPFRKSLGFRLLFLSFIVLALPLLVDSFLNLYGEYNHSIEDAKENLIEYARKREGAFYEIMPTESHPTLKIFNYFLNLGEKNFDVLDEKLNQKLLELAKTGKIDSLTLYRIVAGNRVVVVASSSQKGLNEDPTKFFQLVGALDPDVYKKGYFSLISYDKMLLPHLITGNIIYSNKKQPVGIITISREISEKLNEALKPEKEEFPVYYALLLPNSIVVAASDPQLKYRYFQPLNWEVKKIFAEEEPGGDLLLKEEPIAVSKDIGQPFFEFVWNGEKQIGFAKAIRDGSFSILAYAPRKTFYAQPLDIFRGVYLSYILILLLGGSAALLLTKRMGRPIQKLGQVMEGLRQGNLNLRYENDPFGYEINSLGNIYNAMIDTLILKKKQFEQERISRETYARELEIGREAQRNLLPEKMPTYPGIDLATVYIPAIQVGGDFYDVFVKEKMGRKELVLTVADASGKGVRACFYSLVVKNMLRTFALEYENLGEVLAATNRLFIRDTQDTGMFVTVIMGSYDGERRELSYYSCGHNPLLLRRRDGSVQFINHLGPALGVFEFDVEPARKIQLDSGDIVLFYTDGFTEAHNEKNELYSDERLIVFMKGIGEMSSEAIAESLVKDVNSFMGNAPQHDDMTLLVLKVL